MRLSSLNGKTGFTLSGINANDHSGVSVAAAGDVDKDGYDDIIIGASHHDASSSKTNTGAAYVFFGKKSGYKSGFDLDDLNGSNGFRLGGVDTNDYSGWSVSTAGDVDGDGFDDLLMGAPAHDIDQEGNAGQSYAYYGKSSGFSSEVQLGSLGESGFHIDGKKDEDYSGWSVDTAGDMNGDGKDDLLIGAFYADSSSSAIDSGIQYVIFGKSKSEFGTSVALTDLNGTDGFRLDGEATWDFAGWSVSTAGDVNGDGYDDIVIGEPRGHNTGIPHAYIYYGKSGGYSSEVDLDALNGSNGFALAGSAGSHLGTSVSSAGDMKGDGYDDLIIGSPYTDLHPRAPLQIDFAAPLASSPGEAWVIFGKASNFSANTALTSLDDTEGFRIEGIDAGDQAGFSVSSTGDINGDGYDDIIIGAPAAANKKGESYVIFGGDFTGDSTITSASGDDLLTVSSTSIRSAVELRDNPLTPGDTVNPSSETRDPCLGSNSAPVLSYQGDRSDLFSQSTFLDSMDDDDQLKT